MRKLSIVTLLGIAVLVLFKVGCSDISSSSSGSEIDGIKSVIPARGGYGARVVIGGHGFEPLQKITFNGTEAVAETANDSVIVTRVPMGATTGPIKLIAKGETLTGPVFTVDSDLNLFMSIAAINPQKAYQLDTVKISGSGFSGLEKQPKIKSNFQEDLILPNGIGLDRGELSDNNLREELPHRSGSQNTPIVGKKKQTQPTGSQSAIEDIAVYFNEVEATILSKSDTLLTAIVPLGAQTGLISVASVADTVLGPNFQVLNHSISKISPTTGVAGTEVTITGIDFSPNPHKNIVTFNGKVATVQSASETELIVIAPNDVSTGEVAVTINTIEKKGPVFTVQEEVQAPEIQSITPDNGSVGTEVVITGLHFSAVNSENTVKFNGVLATVQSASATEIRTHVPENASTGPITVTTHGNTVEGPVFTVVAESKSLKVHVETIGGPSGHDGYNLSVSGQADQWIAPNGEYDYLGLTVPQVSVELSDGPLECMAGIAEGNPQQVTLSGPVTDVYFTITCVSDPEIYSITPNTGYVGMEVTITGKNFGATPADNEVWFSGSSTDVQGIVKSASATEIIVEVPYGAETGKISVVVNNQTVEGPVFTVTKKLVVNIITNNASSGHDGYNLMVSGQPDRWVHPNSPEVYEDLLDSQVIIELDQEPMNCVIIGDNPRTVLLGAGTTEVDFVFNCAPEITGIVPASAHVGDTVTVSGNDFNSDASKNKFFFSGESTPVEAVIVQSSSWNLDVIVPAGAVTGAVSVTSDGVSATGPVFTVTKKLVVNIITNNASSGHDGYNLMVSGQPDRWVHPNSPEVYEDLLDSQVIIELDQEPMNCVIVGDNPRTVPLGAGTTEVDFIFNCAPEISTIVPASAHVGDTVTVSGNDFNSDASKNKFFFSGENSPVEAVIVQSSSWNLDVIVPAGAVTGTVSVTSDGVSATGPVFTLLKTLKVHVETTNASPGHDGYNLLVSGQADQWINPSGVYDYTGLTATQVTVELSDGPPQCMAGIAEENPQQVTLSSAVTDVYFSITCVPPPVINSISPDSAFVGNEITIYGENFSEVLSENEVYFSKYSGTVEGNILSATSTQLVVEVHSDAITGPLNISSYYQTVVVPEFYIKTPRMIDVSISTTGSGIHPSGYTLSVTGEPIRDILANQLATYYSVKRDQVEILLEDVPTNCSVTGSNPVTVYLSESNTYKLVEIVVNCED